MDLSEIIKRKAIEAGFDIVGITDASAIDNKQIGLFEDWLNAGYCAQMAYMERNFEKRIEPAKFLANAQSVIVVGLNYKPSHSSGLEKTANVSVGKVSSYALYENYHIFIKKHLREIIDYIRASTGKNFNYRICVDSAPLAERALAVRAGLGFIGKNHVLTNHQLGNQLLLGEIVTTLKLKADVCVDSNCSACNKCIAACPTGALGKDGCFDANKCISYLTIEHKGDIAKELAAKIGERVFGCDECLLACPYQKKAPACKNTNFKFYPEKAEINLQEILNFSTADFEKRFADSPIKRLGLDRLKRNAQICLNNLK